jgi:hypothetical protein
MNSQPSSEQDSTAGISTDVALQELKDSLQSTLVPLAGAWVAAGKALISGVTEASLTAKPLETWEELKHAAKEAIEPLVGGMKAEREPREQPEAPVSSTNVPGMTRGSRGVKARKAGNTTPTKPSRSTAKKRAAVIPSRNRAPRAKAS